jgi:hypothetical protein
MKHHHHENKLIGCIGPEGDSYLALVTPFTKECNGKCLQNTHDKTSYPKGQIRFFFPGPTVVLQSSKSNSSKRKKKSITFKSIGEKNCERNGRLRFFNSSSSWK